jgi:hypothetical protein
LAFLVFIRFSLRSRALTISFFDIFLCSATKGASRRTAGVAVARAFSSDKKKHEMPFGLGKFFGLGEPDNLIATDRDRKEKKHNLPDFLPEDLRKDMEKLEIDNMEDLDELEAKTLDGYNDLGLVPPTGTGTFASPILVPSRRACRTVGYVDPKSHAVFWFNIYNDDNTYYIKDLGLFFKMLHIPDEEAFAAAH